AAGGDRADRERPHAGAARRPPPGARARARAGRGRAPGCGQRSEMQPGGDTMKELQPGPDGVVLENEWVTLVDTRAMRWEPVHGMPGAMIKTMVRGPAGEPLVYITWAPPRLGGGESERHFHRTVREYHFVLEGEVPIWEYDSPEQQHGDFVLFREGYYMDRAA